MIDEHNTDTLSPFLNPWKKSKLSPLAEDTHGTAFNILSLINCMWEAIKLILKQTLTKGMPETVCNKLTILHTHHYCSQVHAE